MKHLRKRGPDRNRLDFHTLNDAAVNGGIITAIPVAPNCWRVKAIAQDGETALLGLFKSRLAALGAGVLLAHRVGARVLP